MATGDNLPPTNADMTRLVRETFTDRIVSLIREGRKVNYRAVGDKILVRPDIQEGEKKTASGLFLAPSASEKPQVGEVVSCELTYYDYGKELPMPCVPGERVLFGKYSGVEVETDAGDKLLFLRPQDVLAIVDE